MTLQQLGISLSAKSCEESKSVLLLGEAGSGKTQAVDWCLQKLKEENDSIITLRARGETWLRVFVIFGAQDMYSSNIECLRHLAQQIAGQLMANPQKDSFEGSMEWFRCIVKESFQRESAVVIVLDRFEQFCGLARQTLLYNLFNLAQDLSTLHANRSVFDVRRTALHRGYLGEV